MTHHKKKFENLEAPQSISSYVKMWCLSLASPWVRSGELWESYMGYNWGANRKHGGSKCMCLCTCSQEWINISILIPTQNAERRKMNYENSNISPCKNIIFKKSSKRNQNPSTNLKFQHKAKLSSFKNPHIKIDLLLILPRGP